MLPLTLKWATELSQECWTESKEVLVSPSVVSSGSWLGSHPASPITDLSFSLNVTTSCSYVDSVGLKVRRSWFHHLLSQVVVGWALTLPALSLTCPSPSMLPRHVVMWIVLDLRCLNQSLISCSLTWYQVGLSPYQLYC